jgi:predicted thioesterase
MADTGRIEVGSSAVLRRTVTAADTAESVGSGSLPVLGTPRLLAWCEAATCAAIEDAIGDGQTSVGTRVSLEHLAGSAVGAEVEVTATVEYVDGRLVRFGVRASQGTRLVGAGEVTRVVVDAERFLGRVTAP